MARNAEKVICKVCGLPRAPAAMHPGALVRAGIAEQIQKAHPDWTPSDPICESDLSQYRSLYVQSLLEKEKGEISELERKVLDSLRSNETLSENVDAEVEESQTFGERYSDRIAELGGSWKFIISFIVVLVVWVTLNSLALFHVTFDPYPFIFLNLVLSCLAAFQAPVIMMSQNRQEAKDRARSKHDYMVNLKAELEIRLMSEKIDHLLSRQWERLVEIQQVQMDLMNQLNDHSRHPTHSNPGPNAAPQAGPEA